MRVWKEYVEELFNDDRPNEKPTIDEYINDPGPKITKHEVIHAYKNAKRQKSYRFR